MALAFDGDGGSSAQYLGHRAATDAGVSRFYLYRFDCVGLRLDGREISQDVRGDPPAGERGPMGTHWRDVGGAGLEYARWRITGSATTHRHTLLPPEIWSGRAHWLESGLLRLQLAASADLQKVRLRLFRYAKDLLE